MDNASEALRIAGAVLIGVMLLALLIAFYNNISGYTKTKDNIHYEDQVSEFNKQFDIYVRDEIYGSDVLSLVNKAADYNVLEVDNKGYLRLEIKVKFTSNYGNIKEGKNKGILFKKNMIYTTDDIIKNMNILQEEIYSLGEIRYKGHKVKELAMMYETDFEILFENLSIKDKIDEAKAKIFYYLELKSDETAIKSTIYKYNNSTYDDATGRVTVIEYVEK